jgi:hypothetical protein
MKRFGTTLRRRDLVWGVGFYCLAHLAFVLAVDVAGPRFYDYEFSERLNRLEQQRREHPERPLLVTIGSSLTGTAFVPERLPTLKDEDGREVLAFNFSHMAAGPTFNLVQLHRLLRRGIVPDWVVLEIVPHILVHETDPSSLANFGDLRVLCQQRTPHVVIARYVRTRLNPFYKHRQGLLRMIAPSFVTSVDARDVARLLPQGGDDGWMRHDKLDDDERARRTAWTLAGVRDRLADLRFDPRLAEANREFLRVCRKQGIRAAVVLMPESSELRACYSEKSERVFREYLDELRQEFSVPLIDARAWLDDDHFSDGHHAMLAGARAYTQRFGESFLGPFVADRLPADVPASQMAER